MAVAAWGADTTYQVGDIRRAITAQVSGLFFKVLSPANGGKSGLQEPNWPTEIGKTVVDNQVTWIAISSVYADISVLAPNAVIELFELKPDPSLHGFSDPIRFHNGCNAALSGAIEWSGEVYSSLAIKVEGFDKASKGTLPRPTMTIANADRIITALLNDINKVTPGNDLTGAEFRRIRTLKKFLDGEATADPNVQWPVEIWYIDKKEMENRDMVVFELASKFDMPGQKVPRRQMIANICQWTYRGNECGYSGTDYWDVNDVSRTSANQDRCGKRVSSCKLRHGGADGNGPLPYGSFPSAGRIK